MVGSRYEPKYDLGRFAQIFRIAIDRADDGLDGGRELFRSSTAAVRSLARSRRQLKLVISGDPREIGVFDARLPCVRQSLFAHSVVRSLNRSASEIFLRHDEVEDGVSKESEPPVVRKEFARMIRRERA